MKTARFLFATIAFGSLTLGLGYAGEPSSQSSGQDPHKNHATSVRPAGPVHGNKNHLAKELHQSGLKKAATAANEGLMKNNTESHREQLARLATGRGATAPLPGGVRGRSATTAVIGGAAASSGKHSAAALDGAGIKRKP
jgi:hypothetical protein